MARSAIVPRPAVAIVAQAAWTGSRATLPVNKRAPSSTSVFGGRRGVVAAEPGRAIWTELKGDPGPPTLATALTEIGKLEHLRALGLPDDLFARVPPKLLRAYGLGTNAGLQRMSGGERGESYKDLLYVRHQFISKEHACVLS
jgi:hypothetical protein